MLIAPLSSQHRDGQQLWWWCRWDPYERGGLLRRQRCRRGRRLWRNWLLRLQGLLKLPRRLRRLQRRLLKLRHVEDSHGYDGRCGGRSQARTQSHLALAPSRPSAARGTLDCPPVLVLATALFAAILLILLVLAPLFIAPLFIAPLFIVRVFVLVVLEVTLDLRYLTPATTLLRLRRRSGFVRSGFIRSGFDRSGFVKSGFGCLS